MSQPVTLTYTNHRGETAERTITPTGRTLWVEEGQNEWHPEPQWFVEALDARSGEIRLFALTGLGKAPAEGGGDEIAEVERLVDDLVAFARCNPPGTDDEAGKPVVQARADLMAAIRALKTNTIPETKATPGAVEVDGWQDIRTAPKDGTRFIALYDRGSLSGPGVAIAYWYKHPSVSGWITDEIDCNDYDFEPTHWRPLPDLPSPHPAPAQEPQDGKPEVGA